MGRWSQSLDGAGPHQVFRKKSSDESIPIFSILLRRGPKNYRPAGREFETSALATGKMHASDHTEITNNGSSHDCFRISPYWFEVIASFQLLGNCTIY